MDRNDQKYWIALKSIDGVGNIGFKNLIDAFGNPQRVFDAFLPTLTAVLEIGKITAANIKDFNKWNKIEKELELIKKYDAHIITYQDHIYPRGLLNTMIFHLFYMLKETCKKMTLILPSLVPNWQVHTADFPRRGCAVNLP
ncbi:MAG TPA: hypothetical protein VEF33_04005 [Syntrophales bacterium]|nr:hypothetical protein [Syntrophales bacterium]